MSKKTKWITACTAVAITASAVLFVICHNWSALVWMLFSLWCIYVVVQKDKLINEQTTYLKQADEHINYLTNHDTWKQIRISETKAQNCLRYLKRIGELKFQVEQLKTLNRNLLHHQEKHDKTAKRRKHQERNTKGTR